MKRKISFFTIILVIILTLFSCTNFRPRNNDFTSYSKTIIDSGFDTFFSLTVYTDSQEKFDDYFNLAKEKFEYYNKLFDIYHNYDNVNNLKTINDNAGIKEVKVESELLELIKISLDYNTVSSNFDITSGELLGIWHQYREKGKEANINGDFGEKPNYEELLKASYSIGSEFILIDEDNSTVFITNPNTSIDVGAIAKGFSVEKIALYLEGIGVEYGVVNAGGNNRIINGKPDGTLYKVGIQDPNGYQNDYIVSFTSNNKSESFVTSGDYQNYYDTEENRYHHLININTLFPATYYRSVTIVCDSSSLADFLSTALFVIPYEDGIKLVNKLNLEYNYNIQVVWILDYDESINLDNSFKKDDFTIIYTESLDLN